MKKYPVFALALLTASAMKAADESSRKMTVRERTMALHAAATQALPTSPRLERPASATRGAYVQAATMVYAEIAQAAQNAPDSHRNDDVVEGYLTPGAVTATLSQAGQIQRAAAKLEAKRGGVVDPYSALVTAGASAEVAEAAVQGGAPVIMVTSVEDITEEGAN